MERRPGDPRALLSIWMEWEQGETTPGKILSDLKRTGMRELLDELVAQLPAADGDEPVPEASEGT